MSEERFEQSTEKSQTSDTTSLIISQLLAHKAMSEFDIYQQIIQQQIEERSTNLKRKYSSLENETKTKTETKSKSRRSKKCTPEDLENICKEKFKNWQNFPLHLKAECKQNVEAKIHSMKDKKNKKGYEVPEGIYWEAGERPLYNGKVAEEMCMQLKDWQKISLGEKKQIVTNLAYYLTKRTKTMRAYIGKKDEQSDKVNSLLQDVELIFNDQKVFEELKALDDFPKPPEKVMQKKDEIISETNQSSSSPQTF